MSVTPGEWFAALSDQQARWLNEMRSLVMSAHPEIREEIKWGQPCYSLNKLVCYLQKAKDHVTIGFQQGTHLADPNGLLEGDGKDMRHVAISLTADEIPSEGIRGLLVAAIHFDKR